MARDIGRGLRMVDVLVRDAAFAADWADRHPRGDRRVGESAMNVLASTGRGFEVAYSAKARPSAGMSTATRHWVRPMNCWLTRSLRRGQQVTPPRGGTSSWCSRCIRTRHSSRPRNVREDAGSTGRYTTLSRWAGARIQPCTGRAARSGTTMMQRPGRRASMGRNDPQAIAVPRHHDRDKYSLNVKMQTIRSWRIDEPEAVAVPAGFDEHHQ